MSDRTFQPRTDPSDFDDLEKTLRERCVAAEITLERVSSFQDGHLLALQIRNGRQSREILLRSLEDIRRVLEIPFERYNYLGDYVAICSYEDSTIEALIQGGRFTPRNVIERAFQGVDDDNEEDTDEAYVVINSDINSNYRLRVGPCSDEMLGLMIGPSHRRGNRRPSLLIEGVPIKTHDASVSILERISSSLFFQIDIERNIQLSLVRERRGRRVGRAMRRRRKEPSEIQFPRMEYDQAPITLYWYASSAIGMPLLQFLAYYQCIEFYYPTYSQAEARRRVRNVLKSPSFRADRDADIGRVLTALTGSGHGSISDERSMLRATLRECIDPDALRAYLEEFEERTEFFSSKAKGLTDRKLPIANRGADLRDDVADRIYDIRCRIVHTKAGITDDSVELLLPFSKEEEMLSLDIALIRFIAQQILIAGSSTLRL